LLAAGFWTDLLAAAEDGAGRPWRRIGAYRRLVESGEMARVAAAYAAGEHAPLPPVRHQVNRSDGRKKVVYTFAPADELLFKGLNRLLQKPAAGVLSRLCHSFQPRRGPRSAYRELMQIPELDRLACLHVDVRDYFNSIPIDRLLATLPPFIVEDRVLMLLLERTLRDPRVIADGRVGLDSHKGVMAGTPLAPFLSNFYLRPLDAVFEASGVPYLRYADDIVVFGSVSEAEWSRAVIEEQLAGLGLQLNPRKTRLSGPGEPWEFLGLRYERGALDIAPHTARKLRRRVRRLARRAREHGDPACFAVRRLNRRLFGVGGRSSEFSWAGWFFPLLSDHASLPALDRLIQEQLRFAVTGVHSRGNLRTVPYAALRRAGYLPLVTAYHAYRQGAGVYQRLLSNRRSAMIVSEHAYVEHPGSAAAADSGLL